MHIIDTCVIVCACFRVVCVCVCACACVHACEKYQGEDTSRDLGDRSRIHLDILNGEDYI